MVEFSILSGLGQDSFPAIDGGITGTLEQQYAALRTKCADRYGEDFCNAVLPRNMVYAVTRQEKRPTIPWWGWLLGGVVLGKLFL